MFSAAGGRAHAQHLVTSAAIRSAHAARRAADGETDWDAVIDAEMARRKLLEDSPIPCSEWRTIVYCCTATANAHPPALHKYKHKLSVLAWTPLSAPVPAPSEASARSPACTSLTLGNPTPTCSQRGARAV